MSSYRRYVAEHGAATARAKRQIRRHSLETGPVRDVAAATHRISRAQCPVCEAGHVHPETVQGHA